MDKTRVTIEVNGRKVHAEVEPRRLLIDFIRSDAGLTGSHVGCDTSYCGACTVLVDGMAVKSCTMLAVQADGRRLTTVEGLATGATLHPLQRAFSQQHALQCGFCTPGFLMSAASLLAANADPSESQIKKALAGNLCRCTGYQSIIAAVIDAARAMREGEV